MVVLLQYYLMEVTLNSTPKTKKCSTCQNIMEVSNFHKHSASSCGYRSSCKSCRKLAASNYYQTKKGVISQKNKLYYKSNKSVINKKARKFYKNNKDKYLARQRNYYVENKDNILARHKEYRKTHKEKNNKRVADRKEYDINYKLSCILRDRILSAIKKQSGKKAYRSVKLLGCTVEKARQHIESQFISGMTWETHGLFGWHIDHIRPCSSFDLKDPKQQMECFHYTNLQPLWAEDNLSKGCKLNT